MFEIPLIINSRENILSIIEDTIEVFPRLNCEETDARLIFHERMSNEAEAIDAKDTDVFLLLIHVLEQLKCFLPSWCMAIDSNQFIKIRMIYNSLVSKIYDVPELHATTSCGATSYKFNLEKVHILKKFVKISPDVRIKC